MKKLLAILMALAMVLDWRRRLRREMRIPTKNWANTR